jgi:hypothetical protein
MTYDKNNYTTSYTRDHFFAKIKGYSFYRNTVLAHQKCNSDKSSRDPNKDEKLKFKKLYNAIDVRVGKLKTMVDQANEKKKQLAAINRRPRREGENVPKW